MLEGLEALNERIAIEKRAIELQKTLKEREEEYAKQTQLIVDTEKKFGNERMVEMRNQLDKALRDRDKAQRDLEEAKSSGASAEALRETLEEREEEYMKQNQRLANAHRREVEFKNQEISELADQRTRIRRERNQAQKALNLALQELDLRSEDANDLQTTIASSLVERRRLMAEINTKEEQIRQRDQAIEDLEGQIERQQEVIEDQTRTEEEREAAQKEVDTLEIRLVELQAEKEKLEKELGLTTKEKVLRGLLKYGVPLAFAIAISSVVGVILSTLNAVGKAAKAMGKKLGNGLTDLGLETKHRKGANGCVVIFFIPLIFYAIYANTPRIIYAYLQLYLSMAIGNHVKSPNGKIFGAAGVGFYGEMHRLPVVRLRAHRLQYAVRIQEPKADVGMACGSNANATKD
ncbi:GRIP domain-containing protein RUD3-like [Actinia tenebrosa]|uniref:GRIP domain-containing protein RUD3-like n=1 Tax=Actinia tenebrosa TaxID=6105 RepID=A0A6P8IIP0_ACTTE|nr:GRIP domain-containing protein RUD3-like [Actinia tenebrosa]